MLRSRPRVAQDVAALDLDQMRGETWGIRENEIEERSNTEGAKRRRAAARKGAWPDGVIAAGAGAEPRVEKGVGTSRGERSAYSGMGNGSQPERPARQSRARTWLARFSRVSPRRRSSASESRRNCSYMATAA